VIHCECDSSRVIGKKPASSRDITTLSLNVSRAESLKIVTRVDSVTSLGLLYVFLVNMVIGSLQSPNTAYSKV